jgi:phosphatidylglycerol:prolipoprotein diacylglycerol transferase
MYPEPLFHILGHGVSLYHLSQFLGILVVLAVALRLGQGRGISPVVVLDAWIIGVVSAWVGHLLSGSILGVIPAALVSLSLFLARHPSTRARPFEVLDVFLPGISFSQALGRLGCLSAGCCHGKPAYGLPWAVTFSHPAAACIYQGIPIHPTQLYEAAGDLVIFAILLALRNRPAFRGVLVWVYLLSYGFLRFVVEFYRGEVRPMVGFLSLSQVICIVFVVIGGIMVARRFLASADVGRGETRF